MIHVCPPQVAPDFIRVSPLADAADWVDVVPHTLRHRTWANVWSLGDPMNAPNAKTAAAARKQAPTSPRIWWPIWPATVRRRSTTAMAPAR